MFPFDRFGAKFRGDRIGIAQPTQMFNACPGKLQSLGSRAQGPENQRYGERTEESQPGSFACCIYFQSLQLAIVPLGLQQMAHRHVRVTTVAISLCEIYEPLITS